MANWHFWQNLQIFIKQGSKYFHSVLHIRNILGTKFQLKLTILNLWNKLTPKKNLYLCICIWMYLWTNITQKRNLRFQREKKIKSTIKCYIIELVLFLNFSFNKHFWFFGRNLSKTQYFQSKTEKLISSLNYSFSN